MPDEITERLYTDDYRARWGKGEWIDEPDYIRWTDPATGYACMMRRNELGAWCGYVSVTAEHPAHEVASSDILRCHWGITWSGSFENIAEWWFGFDCAHAYDYVPSFGNLFASPLLAAIGLDDPTLVTKLFRGFNFVNEASVYRNVAYVKEQIGVVINQLVEIAANPSAYIHIRSSEDEDND